MQRQPRREQAHDVLLAAGQLLDEAGNGGRSGRARRRTRRRRSIHALGARQAASSTRSSTAAPSDATVWAFAAAQEQRPPSSDTPPPSSSYVPGPWMKCSDAVGTRNPIGRTAIEAPTVDGCRRQAGGHRSSKGFSAGEADSTCGSQVMCPPPRGPERCWHLSASWGNSTFPACGHAGITPIGWDRSAGRGTPAHPIRVRRDHPGRIIVRTSHRSTRGGTPWLVRILTMPQSDAARPGSHAS